MGDDYERAKDWIKFKVLGVVLFLLGGYMSYSIYTLSITTKIELGLLGIIFAILSGTILGVGVIFIINYNDN